MTGEAGLHVPESGIVDFRRVAAALQARLEAAGGAVALSTPVHSLREGKHGIVVRTGRGEVQASLAVTCAGVRSDRLARDSGADADGVAIVPFRGNYFVLTPEMGARCRGLIYPVPDPRLPFLGVHVNRRPDGTVWVGPNAVLALAREGYRRRRGGCPGCPRDPDVAPVLAHGTAALARRCRGGHPRSRPPTRGARGLASCRESSASTSSEARRASARKGSRATEALRTTSCSLRRPACSMCRTRLPRARRPRWRSRRSLQSARSRSSTTDARGPKSLSMIVASTGGWRPRHAA